MKASSKDKQRAGVCWQVDILSGADGRQVWLDEGMRIRCVRGSCDWEKLRASVGQVEKIRSTRVMANRSRSLVQVQFSLEEK